MTIADIIIVVPNIANLKNSLCFLRITGIAEIGEAIKFIMNHGTM